jgi:hypothetical protein
MRQHFCSVEEHKPQEGTLIVAEGLLNFDSGMVSTFSSLGSVQVVVSCGIIAVVIMLLALY